MLNLEKLFSEPETKNEIENFAYFDKDVFFRKATSQYFVFFDRNEVFAKAKK
jgi:hypothetical protein